MTLPRGLPPTQEERFKTIVETMAPGSINGLMKSSRPVPDQGASTGQAPPPAPPPGVDRLSVFVSIPYASLTGSSFVIGAWGATVDSNGTAVQLASPDDGQVYTFTPGIYAVTTLLAPHGMAAAPSSCVIGAFTTDGTNNAACMSRGGDPVAGGSALGASSSMTYFNPGAVGDGFVASLRYAGLNPAVSSVDVTLTVQLVSAA